MTEPRPGPDRDRSRLAELESDRNERVGIAVIRVRDVHVMTGEHVIADIDGLVGDDATPPPDQAAITDADEDFGAEVLLRRHAGREAEVRSDHGALPDHDVPFAVEGRDRKTDGAAGAEGRELAGPPAARPHRPQALRLHTRRLQHVARDSPELVTEAHPCPLLAPSAPG